MSLYISFFFFFFFNDTATTEIYTLSLHDALPISRRSSRIRLPLRRRSPSIWPGLTRSLSSPPIPAASHPSRSEEHTSELQSRLHLVCRLLLEKKKKTSSQDRNLSIRYATHLITLV